MTILLAGPATAASGRALLQDITPQVVGGADAPDSRLNFQVGVVWSGSSPKYYHSGILIREDIVLTTNGGFAVNENNAPLIEAVVGTDKAFNDGSYGNGTVIGVRAISWVKPRPTLPDDPLFNLAFLFLQQCVNTTDGKARVIKPASEEDLSAAQSAKSLYSISGWGIIPSRQQLFPKLQYGNATLAQPGTCAPRFTGSVLPDGAICVDGQDPKVGGYYSQDICGGDEGGPLILNTAAAGGADPLSGPPDADRLAGLFYDFFDCGKEKTLTTPVLSVTAFRDWIQGQIDGVPSKCPSPPGPVSVSFVQVSNSSNWLTYPDNYKTVPTKSAVAKCMAECRKQATRPRGRAPGCAAFSLSIEPSGGGPDIRSCNIYRTVPARVCKAGEFMEQTMCQFPSVGSWRVKLSKKKRGS